MLTTKNDLSASLEDSNYNNLSNGDQHVVINNFGNIPTDHNKLCVVTQILEGIAELEESINPIPLDTKPYSIEEKAELNSLIQYTQNMDFYRECRDIISGRVNQLVLSGKSNIKAKLISRVKRDFHSIRHPRLSNEDIVKELTARISSSLNNKISQDDLSFVSYVVFYVFADCHIFDKPQQI